MTRPVANRTGSFDLQYNPYQVAFLAALDLCVCGNPAGVCQGHQHAYNRLTLFAGRRGGKTKVGALAAVRKALARPCYGWVCAPTFGDLNDFVMPSFFQALPDDQIADWSARFYQLTLKNGSVVCFRSLDNPDDARGPGLDWCWIDETCKVSRVAWDTMLPALIDKKGVAWFTTTPRGFDWCYKRFWVPAQNGEPGFWAVQYKTIDNPIIDRALVEEQRKQLDPLFYQQEFEASFVNFTGAIYAIEDAILRDDDAVRAVLPEWPDVSIERECVFGLDPGADHPFAAVLLVKTERGLVAISEYARRNLSIAEHVRAFQGLLGEFHRERPFTPTWAIDRSQKQTSIELAAYGVFVQGAENNIVNGIRRVQSWLASRQLFFIEARTPQLIEKLRAYRWADNFTPDGEAKNKEAVIKEDDDLPDALRYAVMTWPELPDMNATPSAGRRDVSQFDLKTQGDLARIQRMARRERGEDDPDENDPWDDESGVIADANPVGQFWGERVFADEDE